MRDRGISLIALIITIIVIIILVAISIAGVSGIVERSRYAKFCGDFDAIQDSVTQAFGNMQVSQALENPANRKSSEEIYAELAGGGKIQNFVEIVDGKNLGIDLPKYGDSKWYVDVSTGKVILNPGFEYENKVYASKEDIQKGGSIRIKTGEYVDVGDSNPWRVWEVMGNTIMITPGGTGSIALGSSTDREKCVYDYVNCESVLKEACYNYVSENCNKLLTVAHEIRNMKIEDIETKVEGFEEIEKISSIGFFYGETNVDFARRNGNEDYQGATEGIFYTYEENGKTVTSMQGKEASEKKPVIVKNTAYNIYSLNWKEAETGDKYGNFVHNQAFLASNTVAFWGNVEEGYNAAFGIRVVSVSDIHNIHFMDSVINTGERERNGRLFPVVLISTSSLEGGDGTESNPWQLKIVE